MQQDGPAKVYPFRAATGCAKLIKVPQGFVVLCRSPRCDLWPAARLG